VADVSADVVLALALGVLGLVVGVLVDRAAVRFPWDEPPLDRRSAARTGLVAGTTGLLFGLVGLRFGVSWEVPALLVLTAAGMLLALIDLRHRLLPDRVVLPSLGIGLLLLALAALGEDNWPALGRALLGAVALFAVFLVLALISPGGLGMGDVKLAALLGLYLGWLGWNFVVLGAAAGFVVQAVIALALLATRRIGLTGDLPFGPAMLIGAALVVAGWA
jgi:leader peptidase (prepilin peptidase) / N-methyltransferase